MDTTSSPLRTARLLPLLLVLACGADPTPVGAHEGRDPRGQDSGAGDGGAGDDGGGDRGTADTGADGGGDAGLVAPCTVDDLLWSAEVQDEAGNPVVHLSPGQAATLVGRVENPCDEDIVIEVEESCLVAGFEIIDSGTGQGDYAESSCPLGGTGVRVSAGGFEEARHRWSDLPPGTFDLTVHFILHGFQASAGLVVD